MRLFLIGLAVLWITPPLLAQRGKPTAPAVRYGYQPDLEVFPQDTPQKSLGSVLKALQQKRVGYLLAQLADPAWVDDRVRAVDGGKLDNLIKETNDHFAQNPSLLKTLERMLRRGEWKESGDSAEGSLKGTDYRVFFKRIGDRWFFENRKQ